METIGNSELQIRNSTTPTGCHEDSNLFRAVGALGFKKHFQSSFQEFPGPGERYLLNPRLET